MDETLIEAFLHYYQASDSELTSVTSCLLLVDSIFPLIMIMVNIFALFSDSGLKFLTDNQKGIFA